MRKIGQLLASAGALSLGSVAAHAADMTLDVKAPAREPVYRCDVIGFIELPGTDICMRIGGYAALEVYFFEDEWTPSAGGAYGIVPDGSTVEDTFGMYAFTHLNFDLRTETEYGTVRAFIEGELNDNELRTGGSFGLRHAFVQFGNWTFGKTWSTFLHLDSSPIYSDIVTVTGDNYMRRNQIRYTQSLGAGWSVAVAIEDQAYDYPYALKATGVWAPPAFLTPVNDRNEMPDVVAHVRLDGDWGNVQLSGAAHNNEYRDVTLTGAPSGWTDSEYGWAALLGTVIQTPTLGEWDYFTFKAIYTDGATQYNQDNFLFSATNVWGNCAAPVGTVDCILENVSTWSLLASHTHFWSPTLYTTLGAGYMNLKSPLTSFNPFVATLSSDFEMDTYEVFANISWRPVQRTTFMLDVHYGHVDFNGAGTSMGTFNPFIVNPLAQDDQGAFLVALDIRRTF